MNYFRRKLAQEALQEESLVPDSVNLESPDDNLETQLSELPSVEAQLDEMDAAADVLESDIQTATVHVDMAEEAVSEGEELSEDVVKEIEVAQESFRRRYMLNRTRVASESFRNGARGVTKVAHESWKDTLSELWKKFVDLCKAAIAKIKEVKLKYLNAGKSAQNASKKYREAMKKLGTEKAKDEISGDFIAKLSINRTFNPSKSVEVAKALGGKMTSAVSGFATQAANVAHSIEVVKDEVKQDGKAVDLGGLESKIRNLPGFEGDSNSYQISAYPGDIYVQQGEVVKGESKWLELAVIEAGGKPEDTTVKTPSHADLNTAITGLNVVGSNFEKLLQDFRAYDSALEKLEKAAEKMANDFYKKTEDADRASAEILRLKADAEVKKYKATNSLARKVNTNVIKGLNGYIKAGMAAYKKAKA